MITFLHTRIRVSDLEKSVDWYCTHCGFEVKDRNDKSPAGNQIVNLAIPGSSHWLELTYSPDYEVKVPEDLMHCCIGVDDIIGYCQKLEDAGVEIWPADWKTKFAEDEKWALAFIDDPDGYEMEILSNKRAE